MRAMAATPAWLAPALRRPGGQKARSSRRPSRLRSLTFLATLLPALTWWPGCGGGGGGPAEPTQAAPFASGLDFTITPMVNNGTAVVFSWNGTAPAYRLEIGTSPSASDIATFDTDATRSFTWSGVPVGNFYARVRGRQGATVGAGSNEVLVGSIDARQMIDALIFGRGPLAVAGNSWFPFVPDQMEGWQPGTTLRVIVGQSVPDAFATAIQNTAQQVGPATQGAVQASIGGRQPEPLPSPGPGEVTIGMVSAQDVTAQCECDNCSACSWIWFRSSSIQRGKVLLLAAAAQSVPARELGFMIGLGEIISAAGVRPPFTMGLTADGKYLPSGQLAVLDPATVRMLQALYGAGLSAGSTRAEFEAAGFVPPESESAMVPAMFMRGRPTHSVRQDGDESVVIRRIVSDPSLSH